jgi:hypothetical protein
MRVKPIQDIPQQEVDFLPILAIDESYSMQGSKFDNAVKGLEKLVKEFKEGVLIEFADEVTLSNFKDGKLKSLQAYGWTALNDAIKLASDTALSSNKKCLINIFSDGHSNRGKTTDFQASEIIKNLVKEGHTFSFVCTKEDLNTIKNTYGVPESNILTYENNASGVEYAFKMSMDATRMYKSSLAKGENVTLGFYSKVLVK